MLLDHFVSTFRKHFCLRRSSVSVLMSLSVGNSYLVVNSRQKARNRREQSRSVE